MTFLDTPPFNSLGYKIMLSCFGSAVNKSEVECLIKLFDTLVTASGDRFGAVGFDRNMFRDTLHRAFGMTDDMVMDRGEISRLKKVVKLSFLVFGQLFLNSDL